MPWDVQALDSFPKITPSNCRCTSPATDDYNCIAWAYEKDNVWCEPGLFWPIPRHDYTIETYMELFASIGYRRCEDALYEEGFQKIVLYIKDEKPTHAARQLTTGKWTSKLGRNIDVEHDYPEVLDGPQYGSASVFMKREING
jgi:hypothetical protein